MAETVFLLAFPVDSLKVDSHFDPKETLTGTFSLLTSILPQLGHELIVSYLPVFG